MEVSPDEAYAVYVDDKDLGGAQSASTSSSAGASRSKVSTSSSARGPLIRGTVTVGPDDRPAAGQYIRLDETGGAAPEELREKGDHVSPARSAGSSARRPTPRAATRSGSAPAPTP